MKKKDDKLTISKTCQKALEELGRAERIEFDFEAEEISTVIKKPKAKASIILHPESNTKH